MFRLVELLSWWNPIAMVKVYCPSDREISEFRMKTSPDIYHFFVGELV